MRAELPEIARLAHRRERKPASLDLIRRVVRVSSKSTDQPVDLGGLEPRDGDVEIFLDKELGELGELGRQPFAVPSGIRGDLVVGEQQGALLRLA